nr:hypothetical protein GCM10025732_22930 [Glycomyces mayteni]
MADLADALGDRAGHGHFVLVLDGLGAGVDLVVPGGVAQALALGDGDGVGVAALLGDELVEPFLEGGAQFGLLALGAELVVGFGGRRRGGAASGFAAAFLTDFLTVFFAGVPAAAAAVFAAAFFTGAFLAALFFAAVFLAAAFLTALVAAVCSAACCWVFLTGLMTRLWRGMSARVPVSSGHAGAAAVPCVGRSA